MVFYHFADLSLQIMNIIKVYGLFEACNYVGHGDFPWKWGFTRAIPGETLWEEQYGRA
jgi:hypothetical protein